MIAISGVATCIPATVVPVMDLPELALLPERDRATYLSLGIDTVAADEEATPWDLAAGAARRALAEHSVVAGDVDALIVIESRVPDAFMASEATRLQSDIGADRAVTFGVGGLGCVSITPALMTAAGLLATQPSCRKVLVAHGSKPPTPRRRYRHPVTISGDAGLALFVSRDGPVCIVDQILETNGRYWDLFRVDFRDRAAEDWVEACADLPTYSFRLAIESRNRFVSMNEALLARNHLHLGDIDHFVMQNLSEGAFSFYEEAFGIKFAAACRRNLRRYGHLGPIDVVLNIQAAVDTGEFAVGERVLVTNASPVAAWSATLVEIGEGASPSSYLL